MINSIISIQEREKAELDKQQLFRSQMRQHPLPLALSLFSRTRQARPGRVNRRTGGRTSYRTRAGIKVEIPRFLFQSQKRSSGSKAKFYLWFTSLTFSRCGRLWFVSQVIFLLTLSCFHLRFRKNVIPLADPHPTLESGDQKSSPGGLVVRGRK